ncbi:MAG: thioesterase [Clostridia bacterium]|nr:thioesterase [Clostridia bacterium]
MDDRNFVYRHERTYKIRYTDVDVKDKLKPIGLLAFLNEGASTSADELGFGYDVVTRLGYGFILSNWYVEVKRPVDLSEPLTVVTWPEPPQRVQLFRDYEFYSGEEKLGVAIGRWCMVDIKSFKILPTSLVFQNPSLGINIDFNDFTCCDAPAWKIPGITDGREMFSRPVLYSDLDHYDHVNNTKYTDYLFDAFSVKEIVGHPVKSFQITYAGQCKEGDVMHVFREDREDFSIVEVRVDGCVRTQMKVTFW